MTYRIHVNSNRVRSNAKHGTREPVVTVRRGKSVVAYGDEVLIHGPSRVVYSPDAPLPCGAKVWIETDSPVEVNPQR